MPGVPGAPRAAAGARGQGDSARRGDDPGVAPGLPPGGLDAPVRRPVVRPQHAVLTPWRFHAEACPCRRAVEELGLMGCSHSAHVEEAGRCFDSRCLLYDTLIAEWHASR